MSSSTTDLEKTLDVAAGLATLAESDARAAKRHRFAGPVAFIGQTPTGTSRPEVLDCDDISTTGMCVVSRHMLHPGISGAVMIRRPNGTTVVIGVRVIYCNYVGQLKHRIGLQFRPQPDGIATADFQDNKGGLPI